MPDLNDPQIFADTGEPDVAGLEAGLRFAYRLDGSGSCQPLDWDGVRRWSPDGGVLWVHLERDDPQSARWLETQNYIDPHVRAALVAEDTRPRVEPFGAGLLVVLRGVSLNEDDNDRYLLVPIHLWVDAHRVISLRDTKDHVAALRDIRTDLTRGRGPRSVAGLFVAIAGKVVRDIEPLVERLEDMADTLDDRLANEETDNVREELTVIRRRAIELRRYLSPLREALLRLHIEDIAWFGRTDRVALREVADRVIRHVESLDTLRDRATVLHEDHAAIAAERTAAAANRMTALTAIFLPPSLVAGLLGMNVTGIPFDDHPFAFVGVLLLTVALLGIEIWVLRRKKWL